MDEIIVALKPYLAKYHPFSAHVFVLLPSDELADLGAWMWDKKTHLHEPTCKDEVIEVLGVMTGNDFLDMLKTLIIHHSFVPNFPVTK